MGETNQIVETSSVTFPIFFQDGLTSLHIAAHDDLLEIVTILLAGGANPNIQNMVGKRSHMSVYKIYGNIFGQSENGNFTYFHINTTFHCRRLFSFLV